MTEIPQDIIIEAYKAVASVATFPPTDRMELLERVANCILAERKRCAAIADKQAAYEDGDEGWILSAQRIASEIRKDVAG